MRVRGAAALLFLLAGCATAPAPVPSVKATSASASLTVRNNHEIPYAGPVAFRTQQADGAWASADGSAHGQVVAGEARVLVDLPARGSVTLRHIGSRVEQRSASALGVQATDGALRFEWRERALADLDFGLVVIGGRSGTLDQVAQHYRPLALTWKAQPDGALRAQASESGYQLSLELHPGSSGFADVRAQLVRTSGERQEGYLALVRRVRVADATDGRQRFNGRELDGIDSPDTWSRDFWYTHGVDWTSWRTGGVRIAAVHGFTPHPSVPRDSLYGEGSHFWVWERTRRTADAVLLISETRIRASSTWRAAGGHSAPTRSISAAGDAPRIPRRAARAACGCACRVVAAR